MNRIIQAPVFRNWVAYGLWPMKNITPYITIWTIWYGATRRCIFSCWHVNEMSEERIFPLPWRCEYLENKIGRTLWCFQIQILILKPWSRISTIGQVSFWSRFSVKFYGLYTVYYQYLIVQSEDISPLSISYPPLSS